MLMYKLKWLLDRWRVMQHPIEEIYRIRQCIQYFFIDRIWAKHVPLTGEFGWNGLLSGYYTVEDITEIVDETFGDIHGFQFLNVHINNIVAQRNWNYDAKNRISCEKRFVHETDDFDYSKGESKYVYELSRLYQMVPLAAYYVAHGDLQGIVHLKETLRNWYIQNPFLYNVAWKSGNVVGIRAVNLIIFKSLLDLTERDEPFDRFFSDLLELHFVFLQSHLSLYSSQGNHHIGELAGLIAISAAFDFKQSGKILTKCFMKLQSEILRLIHDDGFNKEQATRYQASYINLCMMSLMFARRKGLTCDNPVNTRMQAAYNILARMKIRPGVFFHVGDDDDAQLIYPYPDKNYNIYESMLVDSAVLYGGPIADEYHFDLRNYILLGHEGRRKYNGLVRIPFAPEKSVHLYRNSGYWIYSDNKINLLYDVGPIGLLPTMCHGHSDILSIQLFCHGLPVIVHSGAYQYNVKYKKLRDYFHGVHSHNTISVNGLEQAELGVGMFWLSKPDVVIDSYSETVSHAYCEAHHTGYCRKGLDILHRRRIDVQEDKINITDNLIGDHADYFTFYLHFHPESDVIHTGNRIDLKWEGKRYGWIENPLFYEGHLVKGDPDSPQGWYSDRYDSVKEAFCFVLRCDLRQVKVLRTTIYFN